MKNKLIIKIQTIITRIPIMLGTGGLILFLMFGLNVGGHAQDEVFLTVEEMPRFPGCEEMVDLDEKDKCSKKKLMSFIAENLVYPSEAKKVGTEGMAVIQFVVTPDGNIDKSEIIRDPGNGCGEAAKTVVMQMNEMEEKWMPGRQRGNKVNVQFTLPVMFKLDNKKKETPPPPPPEAQEIFTVVEEMPYVIGCENEDRKACTREKVAAFIIENLKYPEEAKKNKVEGKVVAQFVINKEGGMENIRIARDIGAGCGDAAVAVLEKMSQQDFWMPGKQRGRTVRILYTLPFTFKAN